MWQLTLGLDVAPSHMAGVWFQVTYRPKGQGVVRKTAVQVLPAPRGDRRLAERLDGLFCGYTNMIMDSCLSSRVRLGNGLGWVGLKKMWQLTLGLDVAPSHMAGVWFQVT